MNAGQRTIILSRLDILTQPFFILSCIGHSAVVEIVVVV